MEPVEPFNIEGMTPIEVVEKISATILELTHQAIWFMKSTTDERLEEAYQEGYKDGMKEAVTRITE